MATASPRRRRHLRPRSSAAGPLEDDDLLSEILLRLPPQPSSLPRASAVCTRWRSLASDPGFSRRFRLHHRRSPPLLGFFDSDLGRSFLPTLEAPNRVPPGRFSSRSLSSDRFPFRCLGCRHGLLLLFDLTSLSFLVWDSVASHQHRLACPPGFDPKMTLTSNGAVLRAARDVQHFQVVLVVAGDDDKQQRRVFACVYSSETAGWGNVTSTPIDSEVRNVFPNIVDMVPAVLVGDALYWILTGSSSNIHGFDGKRQILEFDLERQKLAVIRTPVVVNCFHEDCFTVVREDGGGFGFLVVKYFTAQLWKWKRNFGGVASWEWERTIDLNMLLSPHLDLDTEGHIMMIRFAEDSNLLVLQTDFGLFTVQLQSLQCKKLSGNNNLSHRHPFESVYTIETGIGGGHGEANLLQNA